MRLIYTRLTNELHTVSLWKVAVVVAVVKSEPLYSRTLLKIFNKKTLVNLHW